MRSFNLNQLQPFSCVQIFNFSVLFEHKCDIFFLVQSMCTFKWLRYVSMPLTIIWQSMCPYRDNSFHLSVQTELLLGCWITYCAAIVFLNVLTVRIKECSVKARTFGCMYVYSRNYVSNILPVMSCTSFPIIYNKTLIEEMYQMICNAFYYKYTHFIRSASE